MPFFLFIIHEFILGRTSEKHSCNTALSNATLAIDNRPHLTHQKQQLEENSHITDAQPAASVPAQRSRGRRAGENLKHESKAPTDGASEKLSYLSVKIRVMATFFTGSRNFIG